MLLLPILTWFRSRENLDFGTCTAVWRLDFSVASKCMTDVKRMLRGAIWLFRAGEQLVVVVDRWVVRLLCLSALRLVKAARGSWCHDTKAFLSLVSWYLPMDPDCVPHQAFPFDIGSGSKPFCMSAATE